MTPSLMLTVAVTLTPTAGPPLGEPLWAPCERAHVSQRASVPGQAWGELVLYMGGGMGHA